MSINHAAFNAEEWGPEGIAFPISGLSLRVLQGEHPFHLAEADRADKNWIAEKAANPAFFNGRMMLFNHLGLRDGEIVGEGHVVPFSTYLWWRRQANPRMGCHLFGMAVPISSDGAIIAIRMSQHTANPGLVYCAAGSLDENDIVDGHCDVEGNMFREVREETGLDLGEAEADPTLYASRRGRRVSVFRFFRFPVTAAAIRERIAAHMVQDEEKEIDEIVEIRSIDPTLHPYNPAMLPVLDRFFGCGT